MLVECIRVYEGIGKQAWPRVEGCFAAIYRILDEGEEILKETTLMAVGSIGRYGTYASSHHYVHLNFRATSAGILGFAINCLVSQLAKPNPVVRGLAYQQVCPVREAFESFL
jgi:serine/threonine-protein kinase ATR